jgi:hypothetical protein
LARSARPRERESGYKRFWRRVDVFGFKSLIAQEWRDWRDVPIAVAGGSAKHLSAAGGKMKLDGGKLLRQKPTASNSKEEEWANHRIWMGRTSEGSRSFVMTWLRTIDPITVVAMAVGFLLGASLILVAIQQ